MEVTPDTLIPRPDTETLAETAINLLRDRNRGRILDLCCGTGCVGLAVLKNVSDGITGGAEEFQATKADAADLCMELVNRLLPQL